MSSKQGTSETGQAAATVVVDPTVICYVSLSVILNMTFWSVCCFWCDDDL